MIDIKRIREHPKETEELLKRKDLEIQLTPIIKMDTQLRHLKTELDELKSKRNTLSKEIGLLKRAGKDATEVMQEVGELGTKIPQLDQEFKELEPKLKDALSYLPNPPSPNIPISSNPDDNVCIKTVGEKPEFDFPFKNHLELNDSLQLYDFERGAKISGTGWPIYKGLGARLEWALLQYMVQKQIENGFSLWMLPYLVHPQAVYGSGQLPKFEGQQFKVHDEDYHLYLIPTAEVPLTALHADEIIPAEELPKKYTAQTPCFRREAGAAGSKERGLIRIHQFNKVEMYCYTKPEQAEALFEEMMASAESILQGLGLHYRNMLLVTGDMSFPAVKTVDIEVWLPGQDRYYEVSSVSNCTDFQARRSNIRYREKGEKTQFVHTLNGSGLATPRLTVALLENNQQEDGSILIPDVLSPYMSGIKRITPKAQHDTITPSH